MRRINVQDLSFSRTLAALACVAALGAPGRAAAQPPPAGPASTASAPATPDKADDLYRKARAAIAANDWPRAFDLLLSAYQLKKSHDIVSHLGQAELRLGKFRDAAEHLAHGLALYPATGSEEGRKRLTDLLADAKKEVGTLVLRVTPATALVNIDGKRVDPENLPHDLYVDPGEMRIEAGGIADHDGAARSVKIAKGQRVELALTLTPRTPGGPTASSTATAGPGPTTSVTTAPPTAPGPNKVVAIAGGAVAGVSLIAGAVLLGVATGQLADLEKDAPRHPDGTPFCVANPPAGTALAVCDDFRDRARGTNALGQSGVGLLIAGGALAAGTLLYTLWPRTPQKPSAALVPVAGPTGAGLLITGSF